MEIDTMQVKGGTLEYLEEVHTYIYEGQILPSITQIMQIKFGNKYSGINADVLKKAAMRGTAIHQAIEDYEKENIEETGCVELRNWKFLKRLHNFKCLDNEVPVVLFKDDEPVACGTLDLVLEENGEIGLGDIKTTSKLDKEYLAYQLNLYRIGYQQCYGKEITFLRGVHLREDKRKYEPIPIKEEMAMSLIDEYLEKERIENGK